MKPKSKELTDYLYTREDFFRYFEGVLAHYRGALVCVVGCVPTEWDGDIEDHGSVEWDDFSTMTPITTIIMPAQGGTLLEVDADELVYSKPPGITFEYEPRFGLVGYIRYMQGGYRKGVSFSDYKLKCPTLACLSASIVIPTNLIINPDPRVLLLAPLYRRKRGFSAADFQALMEAERYGMILDQDYYLTYLNTELALYFRQSRVGCISGGKLHVPKKTKRLNNLVKKMGIKYA